MERGRSLMDPQRHPLLHLIARMKQTFTNIFLRQKCGSHRGKIWAIRSMLKCFPVKSLKLCPSPLAVWEQELSCKRMIPFDSIPGRFNFMARCSTLSHQETNHTSLLFFGGLYFQCWMNTLYLHFTHLQRNKETTV